MRRRTLLLAALAALAVAGTAGSVANRHPRDPREAFTAADQAWAGRIPLGRSDLSGGWQSVPSGEDDVRCKSFDPDLLAYPPLGVRRFAFRTSFAVDGGGGLRIYLDVIAWDRGRASATLMVSRIGAPPDRAFELRLARRMDARMRR